MLHNCAHERNRALRESFRPSMSLEILSVFFLLGCTSFGGPIAHPGLRAVK